MLLEPQQEQQLQQQQINNNPKSLRQSYNLNPKNTIIRSKQKGFPSKKSSLRKHSKSSLHQYHEWAQNENDQQNAKILLLKKDLVNNKKIGPFCNQSLQQKINQNNISPQNNSIQQLSNSFDVIEYKHYLSQQVTQRNNLSQQQQQNNYISDLKKMPVINKQQNQKFEKYLDDNLEQYSPGRMASKILQQEQHNILKQKDQIQNSLFQDGIFYHLPISRRTPSINQGVRSKNPQQQQIQQNSPKQNNKNQVEIHNVANKLLIQNRPPVTSYLTQTNNNLLLQNQKLKKFTQELHKSKYKKQILINQLPQFNKIENIQQQQQRAQSVHPSSRRRHNNKSVDFSRTQNNSFNNNNINNNDDDNNNMYQQYYQQQNYLDEETFNENNNNNHHEGSFMKRNIQQYDTINNEKIRKNRNDRDSYKLGFFSQNNSPIRKTNNKNNINLINKKKNSFSHNQSLQQQQMQQQMQNQLQQNINELQANNPVLKYNGKNMRPQYMKKYSLIFNRVFDNSNVVKDKFE